MKKILIALVLGLAALSASAANWKTFAESTTHQFQGDISSIDFGTNNGDEPIVYIKGRVIPPNGNIVNETWTVRFTDCDAGFGNLVTLSSDGGEFKTRDRFYVGGTNIANGIAGKLCYAYKRAKQGVSSGSSI